MIVSSIVKSWQDFCSNTEGVSATTKLHKLLYKDPTICPDWVRDTTGSSHQPALPRQLKYYMTPTFQEKVITNTVTCPIIVKHVQPAQLLHIKSYSQPSI